jgi:hypothetical protein
MIAVVLGFVAIDNGEVLLGVLSPVVGGDRFKW